MKAALFAILALTASATVGASHPSPQPRPTTCVVFTTDADGYLDTMRTADGKPLSFKEATAIATLLNARHNNGPNAVEAKLDCS